MDKKKLNIRPITERRFAQIPILKIVIINSRKRDEDRFKESMRSIAELGLYKPICVNERRLKKTGEYELVCGEGRLEACRQLGMTHIEAEIIDTDDETALLIGLVENLTRTSKTTIDFARRILQMYERGMTYAELERITGRSAAMMPSYITLMKKGEERLIRGVEDGIFTISFAMMVAENSQSEVQHFIMDSFLSGEITQNDLNRITRILEDRTARGLSNTDMTMRKLKTEIKAKTKECKMFCEQGKIKRNDAIFLNECLRKLWEDEKFKKMLEGIKDLKKPELKGKY